MNSGRADLTNAQQNAVFNLFFDAAEAKARAAEELERNGGDPDVVWRLRQAASDNYRRAELAARDIGILNAELQSALEADRLLAEARERRTRGRG